MTPQDMVEFFLTVPAQLKLLHWQTTFYARHKALDKFYEAFEDLADTFVETYFGIQGRVQFEGRGSLRVFNEDNLDLSGWLNSLEHVLVKELPTLTLTPDLIALRDEMLQELNHFKYLITLQ